MRVVADNSTGSLGKGREKWGRRLNRIFQSILREPRI